MNLFIDSSAFVALRSVEDPAHRRALQLMQAVGNDYAEFVTSHFIIAESITVISQKVSHHDAVDFRDHDIADIRVMRITEELEYQAFEIFRNLTSKNVSFIDCTSFALMRSLGLTTAFAFDDHFKQHRFKLLK